MKAQFAGSRAGRVNALKRKSGVIVVKGSDGKLGWRAIDAAGHAITPNFGKIYGVDGEPAALGPDYERSRQIIDRILRSVQQDTKAKALRRSPVGSPAAKRREQAIRLAKRRIRKASAGGAVERD